MKDNRPWDITGAIFLGAQHSFLNSQFLNSTSNIQVNFTFLVLVLVSIDNCKKAKIFLMLNVEQRSGCTYAASHHYHYFISRYSHKKMFKRMTADNIVEQVIKYLYQTFQQTWQGRRKEI